MQSYLQIKEYKYLIINVHTRKSEISGLDKEVNYGIVIDLLSPLSQIVTSKQNNCSICML